MSEDNIIFLNDLLLPHFGAISTFSRPRTVKASRSHVWGDIRILFLIVYRNTYAFMFPSCSRYGFGLLDAGLMVQQGTLFNTVSPQRKCIKEVTLHPTR